MQKPFILKEERLGLNIYFILFESLVILLFGFTIRHAIKAGLANVFQLLAGVLFGIFLELATIQQLHAYSYGQFFLMVIDVPLVIGISWGIILYSVRLTSDRSNLPWMIRPCLDGLLALNIDLAMDALAIRLGMWNWGENMQFEYFGVPYANFWAWFWVVFFFSSGVRVLTRWFDKTRVPGHSSLKTDLVIALGGLFIGLVGVLSTNAFIVYIVPEKLRTMVIAATFIAAVIATVCFRPKLSLAPGDSIAFWVAFSFHGYFLIIGTISGIIFEPFFLLGMSLAMLFVSLYWHRQYLMPILTRKARPDFKAFLERVKEWANGQSDM